jgi:hypothetical protein
MYLVHLAYLGQEAPAVKDLISSIKEPLGIAAADAAGLRAFPSPSEKRLYLSDNPPEKNFDKENMDSSPKPGAGQPASPAGSTGAAGSGENSANQSKEVIVTDVEAQTLREENERLKKEAEAKDIALSDAAQQRRIAARERLKSAMDEKGVPKPVETGVLNLSDSGDAAAGSERIKFSNI